jgi:hypothetical protein
MAKIYVGNPPFSASKPSIRDLFAQLARDSGGRVLEVNAVQEREQRGRITGPWRGR